MYESLYMIFCKDDENNSIHFMGGYNMQDNAKEDLCELVNETPDEDLDKYRFGILHYQIGTPVDYDLVDSISWRKRRKGEK